MARPRRLDGEDGFTLIELSIVIVVIAILIAMTMGQYLGARARAGERAAQTNARTGFEAERILWLSTGFLSSDAATALPQEEPSVHWLADAVPNNSVQRTVVVSVGSSLATDDTIVLGVKSSNGVCFYMRNAAGGAIQYARDSACGNATNTLVSGATNPAGGWKPTW